jgi:molecular chaperone DnaK
MSPPGESNQYFRESTRAPLRAPVSIQVDAFKDPESGFSGNISLGGLFIEMETPLPVGTIVKFELHLEPPLEAVRGTAEIVWIRPDKASADKPAGMGLQFRHLQENGEEIVRGAVEEVLQAQGLTVEPPTVAKPKPRPRRPRPAPAAEQSETSSSKRDKPKKKTHKKASGKGSKKTETGAEERKKLIMAIILIAVLIFVLTRTLG